MLSQAVEDYLKTIYKLHKGDAVSTNEIARTLDVSSASVTNMVKRLAKMGLVEHHSYQGVTLTAAGDKIALEIIRHHRLLETYLREIMGYGWEEMHTEAEHLEHHISEEFEDRLDRMLGFPTHDPHGDPIPSREGIVPDMESNPLTRFDSGDTVSIRRLPDTDPNELTYLESIGLLPDAKVQIIRKGDSNGPITVRIDGTDHVLEFETADRVFCLPA